jgi:hypothetical protein
VVPSLSCCPVQEVSRPAGICTGATQQDAHLQVPQGEV